MLNICCLSVFHSSSSIILFSPKYFAYFSLKDPCQKYVLSRSITLLRIHVNEGTRMKKLYEMMNNDGVDALHQKEKVHNYYKH